jgi:hypothetical protein
LARAKTNDFCGNRRIAAGRAGLRRARLRHKHDPIADRSMAAKPGHLNHHARHRSDATVH